MMEFWRFSRFSRWRPSKQLLFGLAIEYKCGRHWEKYCYELCPLQQQGSFLCWEKYSLLPLDSNRECGRKVSFLIQSHIVLLHCAAAVQSMRFGYWSTCSVGLLSTAISSTQWIFTSSKTIARRRDNKSLFTSSSKFANHRMHCMGALITIVHSNGSDEFPKSPSTPT